MMLGQDLIPGRFHESDSEWIRSFSCADVKCLVVCRGPVRREAFDVFEEMGIREYGMLLSEKDSIVYPRCLAPEIRSIKYPGNIHRVQDYMGVGQEEKIERIGEIIDIALEHGYTHLFAGYGFMAEDADFVQAIENAGLSFIGPSASVIRKAGAKDEAKKLARELGNAVIPGIDNISALALVARVEDRKGLETTAAEKSLAWSWDDARDLDENAEALLQVGYSATCELVTVEGVAEPETLHPIQRKLLEHAALQCGICTPGIVVAAKALLEEHPDPTEEQTRYWLAGNLCRCTGYDKIIRAVLDAAAEMRGAA